MTTIEAPNSLSTSEQIIELTDATFDRVQTHVNRYTADSRRTDESGGIILSAHESFLHGPDQKYGQLVLKICNRQAERTVIGDILCSEIMEKSFREPSGLRTKGSLTNLPDWVHLGYTTTFKVARDCYPQGNPAYRFWRGPAEEDDSEHVAWGERHKIGFALISLYQHRSLPLYEQHTQSVSLATRFDKDRPLLKADHTARVVIENQADGPHQQYFLNRDEQPSLTPIGTALRELRGFLGSAKDLRPAVAGVASEAEYNEFLATVMSKGARSGLLPILPTNL